jgi:hypothetical protein
VAGREGWAELYVHGVFRLVGMIATWIQKAEQVNNRGNEILRIEFLLCDRIQWPVRHVLRPEHGVLHERHVVWHQRNGVWPGNFLGRVVSGCCENV